MINVYNGIGLLILVMDIWVIIAIINSGQKNKLLWVVIIILLPVIGPILWLVMRSTAPGNRL